MKNHWDYSKKAHEIRAAGSLWQCTIQYFNVIIMTIREEKRASFLSFSCVLRTTSICDYSMVRPHRYSPKEKKRKISHTSLTCLFLFFKDNSLWSPLFSSPFQRLHRIQVRGTKLTRFNRTQRDRPSPWSKSRMALLPRWNLPALPSKNKTYNP